MPLTSTACSLRATTHTLRPADGSAPRRGRPVLTAGRTQPTVMRRRGRCQKPVTVRTVVQAPSCLTGLSSGRFLCCPVDRSPVTAPPTPLARGCQLPGRLRAGVDAGNAVRRAAAPGSFLPDASADATAPARSSSCRDSSAGSPASGRLEDRHAGLAGSKTVPRSFKKKLYSARKVTTITFL